MEEVNVKVLFVAQYKDGKKSSVKFAIENNSTKNQRGFLIIDQWFDNNIPFVNITDDLIDVVLQGKIAYRKTYGENAKMKLVELYDEAGNNLLA